MPAYYDIYGISKRRDKETIERFLNYYSHRDKIEIREDLEIGVSKNEEYGIHEIIIPIKTLSEVIDYGIKNRNHGYVFYIGDNLKSEINHIILKFTYDEKMIYGISVEEKDNKLQDNYPHAFRIEKEIALITNSYESSIQFEYAPSDDEREFYEDKLVWEQMNEEKKKEFKLS